MAVAVAACGGASKRAQTTSSSTSPTTATATTTPPPTTTPATTTSYPSTTSHTATSGATGVRLPATFTIEAGGKLSPPTVTAPAGVTIDLTLVSGDGKPYLVRGPFAETLPVPPHGHGSVTLRGLHRGHYPVIVDGVPRGTLIVGGQVGP